MFYEFMGYRECAGLKEREILGRFPGFELLEKSGFVVYEKSSFLKAFYIEIPL